MDNTSEQHSLYLVGFRIDADRVEPQVFTVYIEGERPIFRDGQPILFTQPTLAPAALAISNCGASAYGAAPTELNCVFDLPSAIYVLAEENEAPDGETLDCINILLDFANHMDETIPVEYRSCLESLADHLTFNKEFAHFLIERGIDRRLIMDAVYWVVGAICCNVKFVDAHNRRESIEEPKT
jgi:hypothetical protein